MMINGIKIFSRKGLKLPDSMEEEIESFISSKETNSILSTTDKTGKVLTINNAEEKYVA